MVGSGIGGLDTIDKNSSVLDTQGIREDILFSSLCANKSTLRPYFHFDHNLKGPGIVLLSLHALPELMPLEIP